MPAPAKGSYLYVVSMDVDKDKEALFNEVYDTEHVPLICKVPGVRSATRLEGGDFTQQIGGKVAPKAHEGAKYVAIYNIDGPHVLLSKEWAEQAEQGRWPGEVRPFTTNRSHKLFKVR